MLLRWHISRNSISRIDLANRVAYLEKLQYGIVVVPPRYYVENLRALLDAPGEWFFDTAAGRPSISRPRKCPIRTMPA